MRKSWCTDEQIVASVHEAERGARVAEICRHDGVRKKTLRRWRAKYRGMGLQAARRLKQLEEENWRLKKLVADLSLDKTLLKEVVRRMW